MSVSAEGGGWGWETEGQNLRYSLTIKTVSSIMENPWIEIPLLLALFIGAIWFLSRYRVNRYGGDGFEKRHWRGGKKKKW